MNSPMLDQNGSNDGTCDTMDPSHLSPDPRSSTTWCRLLLSDPGTVQSRLKLHSTSQYRTTSFKDFQSNPGKIVDDFSEIYFCTYTFVGFFQQALTLERRRLLLHLWKSRIAADWRRYGRVLESLADWFKMFQGSPTAASQPPSSQNPKKITIFTNVCHRPKLLLAKL